MLLFNNKDKSMMKWKIRKTIRVKNKKRQEKLYRKWPFGENFTQAFMMRMAIIFRSHYRVPLNKSELRKKHWTIIYYKYEMEKNMDSILMRSITVRSDSCALLFVMRKRKHSRNDFVTLK